MTHKGLAESKEESYNSIYKPSTEQQTRTRREQALGDPASPDQVKDPLQIPQGPSNNAVASYHPIQTGRAGGAAVATVSPAAIATVSK